MIRIRMHIVSVALATSVSSAAVADRCPVCGQDPCSQASRPRKAPIVVPPPESPRSGDFATGAFLSGFLSGAANMKVGTSKLLSRPPTALLSSIDRVTASYEDYRNPKSFEQWGRAVQADAMIQVVKAVYGGTLGTAPALTPKVLSLLNDAQSNATSDGPPSRGRIEQFFNLLDQSVSEVSSGQNQSFGPQRLFLASLEPEADSTRSLREKMWHAVLSAYHGNGQFDQAVEFHRMALDRWGAAQDASVRDSIQALSDDARNVLAFPVKTDPSGENAVVNQLSKGSAMFLNFRFPDSGGRLELELTGGRPKTGSEPEHRIVLHADEKSEQLEMYAIGLVVPAGISVAESLNSWSALRFDYRDTAISITLNGRFIGRFSAVTKDSGGAFGFPPSFTIKLQGRGQFRTSFRKL